MSSYNLPFRTRSRSGRRSKSKSKTRSDNENDASRAINTGKSRSSSRSKKRRDRSENRHKSGSPHRGAKADLYDSEDEDGNQEPEPWTTCPPELAKASMPPGLVKQYETAGLEYNQPLPKGRFPHASPEYRDPKSRFRRKLTKRELHEELLKINPPPLGSSRDEDLDKPAEPASQRQQSTALLVEILHMCLRRGDYTRANRAFGILLRTQIDGNPLELRSDGFWGIGAEILMHLDRPKQAAGKEKLERERTPRGRERDKPDDDGGVLRYRFDNSDVQREAEKERARKKDERKQLDEAERRLPMPSPSAWAAIKIYYEHLIIQYPQSKSLRAGQASASDFYLAMFSTWIAHLQDMHDIEEEDIRSDLSAGEALDDALDDARHKQLGRASELVKRLDEVLGSLSYSDDPTFVELRANVELWLADLCTPVRILTRFRYLSSSQEPTVTGEQYEAPDSLPPSESDSVLSKEDEVPTSAQQLAAEREDNNRLRVSLSRLEKARLLFARAEELKQTMHLRIR